MAVFQTEGDPPKMGKIIFVNIGSSRKRRHEPRKAVAAKMMTMLVELRAFFTVSTSG